MKWNKVLPVLLLALGAGLLLLNHTTINRQQQRIAALEQRSREMQSAADALHLQMRLASTRDRVAAGQVTAIKEAFSDLQKEVAGGKWEGLAQAKGYQRLQAILGGPAAPAPTTRP